MTEPRPERWLVTSGAARRQVRCRRGADDAVLEIEIGGSDTARTFTATIVSRSEDTCVVAIAGQSLVVRLAARGDGFDAMVDGETFTAAGAAEVGADPHAGAGPNEAERSETADLDALAAPMPAAVSAILVEPGTVVEAGDTLVRLEAMKMELAIRAPSPGRVTSVDCRVGDLVQPGRPLIALDPAAGKAARTQD